MAHFSGVGDALPAMERKHQGCSDLFTCCAMGARREQSRHTKTCVKSFVGSTAHYTPILVTVVGRPNIYHEEVVPCYISNSDIFCNAYF